MLYHKCIQKMKSLVRCFRRLREEGRCGVWAMTQGLPGEDPKAWGAFFHGDREEVQPPRYDLDDLIGECGDDDEWALGVEEITPGEALVELVSWPEGQAALHKILEKWPA